MTTSNTFSGRIPLAPRVPLKIPRMVYVECTNFCNFGCSWCPTGAKLQRQAGIEYAHASDSLFEKIVADIREWVNIAGEKIGTVGPFWMGEPFMNPKLPQIIRTLKDAEIADSIAISTNGSLLVPKLWDPIIESGLDVMSVSMYGTSDAEYAGITRRISYSGLLEQLRAFREHRDARGSRTPLLLAKFFQRSDEAFVLESSSPPVVDRVVFESPFNWSASFSELSGRTITVESAGPMTCCPSPWFVLAIGADGSVSPCCADWGHKAKLGNAHDTHLIDIWNGEAMHAFRKNIVENNQSANEACKGCTYYQIGRESATCLDDLFATEPARALQRPFPQRSARCR